VSFIALCDNSSVVEEESPRNVYSTPTSVCVLREAGCQMDYRTCAYIYTRHSNWEK